MPAPPPAVWQNFRVDLREDLSFRERIFAELANLVAEKQILQRRDLEYFELDGTPCRLADRSRGIWNPRDLNATLSILSTPDSDYPDVDLGDDLFAYAYREGTKEGDNRKLRKAYEYQLPVIWHRGFRFKSTVRYIPVFPVYVVEDDPENQRVIVSLDPQIPDLDALPITTADDEEIAKEYSYETKKRRLHQRKFRGRLLRAYEMRCAVCRLGQPKLLDGAHITADNDEDGTPSVDNGLSLCKIHHAAYDADLLGISPDYRIHISEAFKKDANGGPVAVHGFLELDGGSLAVLPESTSEWPSKSRLDQRFKRFMSSAEIDVAWVPRFEL